jgi:hypothetical protein
MRDESPHLIIQGDFAPAKSSRVLRVLTRVLSLLLLVSLVGALVVYGVKVHYVDDINRVARDTREMNEQNKELQVRLNHIRSFKNVEAAATKVPHLHLAETIIDVPASANYRLPAKPPTRQEFPRIYGY